jgi:hypothetical protein
MLENEKIYFVNSVNLSNFIMLLKETFTKDEYKDIKDAFIDLIVSFSEEFDNKAEAKQKVESYFNFVLDDSLFSKKGNYYDLSRMLYLTGKKELPEDVKEILKYRELHNKIVNVLREIVKVNFLKDVNHKEKRIQFLNSLLLKKDDVKVEESELMSYISQNSENRHYDYNKNVQVYEELLDLFIEYLNKNDTANIKKLDIYNLRYTMSQDGNFVRYKDIIDFYKNIIAKDIDIGLKNKLRRLVAELFMAGNMMTAIKKNTQTIHHLSNWDTPFNVLRPTALELMTYALLKRINELTDLLKNLKNEKIIKNVNEELENHNSKADELLKKLENINKKLVECANISTDIREKKANVKIDKNSIEIDFTDFSKPENKISIGGVYDDYMFNFHGTIVIRPLLSYEVSNMHKKDITNIYLFRQQMRRLLDNIYDSLLENVVAFIDLKNM